MYRLLALPVFLALIGPAAAGEKTSAASLAKAIAPFLGEQAVAVIHIDLKHIDPSAFAVRVGKAGKLSEKDVAEMKRDPEKVVRALKDAGLSEFYAVFELESIASKAEPLVVFPLADKADVNAAKRTLQQVFRQEGERVGNALVVGDKGAIERAGNLKPVAHPEVAKGFAAAGDASIRAVGFLPKHLRRAVEEAMPNLPEQLGGGSIKAVTEGLSWAALGVDLTPKFTIRVTVQAKDAAAAKELSGLYESASKALGQLKPLRQALPNYDGVVELLTPKVEGDRLTVALGDKVLGDALLPMVQKVREAAARTQSMNNLRQLSLAMLNYYDTYKHLPEQASHDKQGRPLLSWRVHILPFLDQKELYDQFHLDEPWDSEHNKKLIAKIPPMYMSPLSAAPRGKTTYLVPVGKDTAFPPGQKLKIADITDGTSNTIGIIEADDAHAVEWTRPADLPYDPKLPLRGLGGRKEGRFSIAFLDGSVHSISREIALDTLRALFTRNGGEVVGELP
jgi:hypothetical protein